MTSTPTSPATPSTPTVTENPDNAMLGRLEGPSPALQVGLDMIKRGLVVGPVLVGLGAVLWGADGAASVLYGLVIVLFNLWLSAFIIAFTARISFAMVAAGALFGFLIRLCLVMVAVLVVKDMAWVDLIALGLTLIVAHLGLLFWELRYVSASLAYPGLKPGSKSKESARS